MRKWIAFSISLLCSSITIAQPTTTPTTNEFPSVLTDVRLNSVSLEEVIKDLRAASGLNIVIQREPHVAPNYPQIDSMELKNVTVPQVLATLVQSYPALQLQPVADPTNNVPTTVYVVRVKATRDSISTDETSRGTPMVVTVYNLASLTSPDEGPARAANDRAQDVLTLLQAVLGQTDGPKALIQFHEPTASVIVKASPEQQQAVASALETLNKGTHKTTALEKLDSTSLGEYRKWYQKQIDTIDQLSAKSPVTQP